MQHFTYFDKFVLIQNHSTKLANHKTLVNISGFKSLKFSKELNVDQMIKLRLIHKNDLVKILGRGKLTIPVKITAHKFSASAKSAIESAGGEAITL